MRKLCLVLLLVVACRKSEQIADSTVGKEGGEPMTQAAAGQDQRKTTSNPNEVPPSTNNPNIAPESTNDPNKPRLSNNDPNNPPASNSDPNRIAAPRAMEDQPVRWRSGGKTVGRGGNVDPLPAVMELKLGADGYYRDRDGRRVLLTIVEDDAKPASPGR